MDDGNGVAILTDILGGTPTNLSLSFLKDEKVEGISDFNCISGIMVFALTIFVIL